MQEGIVENEQESILLEHGIPLEPLPWTGRGRGRGRPRGSGRGGGRGRISNGVSKQPRFPILPPKAAPDQQPVLGQFVTRHEKSDINSPPLKPTEDEERPKVPKLHIKKPVKTPILGKFVTRPPLESADEIEPSKPYVDQQQQLLQSNNKVPVLNIKHKQLVEKSKLTTDQQHQQPVLGQFVTRPEKIINTSASSSNIIHREPKVPDQPVLGQFVTRPEKSNINTPKAEDERPRVPKLHIKKPVKPKIPEQNQQQKSGIIGQFVTRDANPESKGQSIHEGRKIIKPKLGMVGIPKLVIKKDSIKNNISQVDSPVQAKKTYEIDVDSPPVVTKKALEIPKIVPCTVNLEKIDTSPFMKAPTSIVHEGQNKDKSPSNVIANPDPPPPVFNEFKRPAIKLNMKTLKSKIKHQKHSKQIAEKSKQQTADDDEVPVMPLLKIKLPSSASRPKRTLLNVLTGLSKSLPKIPSTEIPWIPKNDEIIETDFTEKELQEEANR